MLVECYYYVSNDFGSAAGLTASVERIAENYRDIKSRCLVARPDRLILTHDLIRLDEVFVVFTGELTARWCKLQEPPQKQERGNASLKSPRGKYMNEVLSMNQLLQTCVGSYQSEYEDLQLMYKTITLGRFIVGILWSTTLSYIFIRTVAPLAESHIWLSQELERKTSEVIDQRELIVKLEREAADQVSPFTFTESTFVRQVTSLAEALAIGTSKKRGRSKKFSQVVPEKPSDAPPPNTIESQLACPSEGVSPLNTGSDTESGDGNASFTSTVDIPPTIKALDGVWIDDQLSPYNADWMRRLKILDGVVLFADGSKCVIELAGGRPYLRGGRLTLSPDEKQLHRQGRDYRSQQWYRRQDEAASYASSSQGSNHQSDLSPRSGATQGGNHLSEQSPCPGPPSAG